MLKKGEDDNQSNFSSRSGSKIRFDDTSIQIIFSNPSSILRDVKSFWENNVPYQMATIWAQSNSIPVNYEKFTNIIEEIEKSSPTERKRNKLYIVWQEIMDKSKTSLAEAIPHIYSYLPTMSGKIETTVYLASFARPRAFVCKGNVIMNLSHEFWKNDVNMILNSVVHEIFHIGHGLCHNFYQAYLNSDSAEERSKAIMNGLQSEGMATYVAYRALDIFPSTELDPDYAMIEDERDIEILGEKVNNMFRLSKSASIDEIREYFWQEGVMGRALYVTGAYMAKCIEEDRGRKSLVETLVREPKEFVDDFNQLNSKVKIRI